MAQKKRARTRRRERKNIPVGKAFIQSTFNNTIITLTDPRVMSLPGAAPALPVSKAPAKELPTPPRWPLVRQCARR